MTDRRAGRHQATRRELIAAAWVLARRKGLTGWTLRELAAAVGMRAPSLYVYFDSKSSIYDAMYAEGYDALLAAAEGLDRTRAPLEVLRLAAHGFVDFAVADPARLQLMFLRVIPDFEPSQASYARAVRVLGLIAELLADAGLAGSRPLDLWTATLTGLATQQVSNDPGGTRWTRLVDDVVDMLVASQWQPAGENPVERRPVQEPEENLK